MTMLPGSAECERCSALTQRVAALEAENEKLRAALATREDPRREPPVGDRPTEAFDSTTLSPLTRSEMQRYSRQMLVSDFRVSRQLKLRQARVLIVGAGGLGCPAALYLGAMGVGCLGLVDNDRVERSNLHRQIGHTESAIGELKVDSLARRVRSINGDVKIETHAARFTPKNAVDLVREYDVVVDASDNPPTRYLVNEACAVGNKPLVSGSALGLEGQISVFTYADDTACYRCLYPSAPRQPQSCEENGVLGIVPGIIGCLQALETVRLLTEMGQQTSGSQLLFDAYDGQFRRVKIPKRRRDDCCSCGPSKAALTEPVISSCGSEDAQSVVLGPVNRVDVGTFASLRKTLDISQYVLLDTRATHQFEMVHFPEAVNIPFKALQTAQAKGELVQLVEREVSRSPVAISDVPMLVICRRGVDSVAVTSWLLACGLSDVRNVDGGYTLYAALVDARFPMY